MVPVIIIAAVIVVIAGGSVVIFSTKRQTVKGSSLGVIGGAKVGKTSFLYRLGLSKVDGGDGQGDRTQGEDYITPAIIKTSKGNISILPGKDYGGSPDFQKQCTAKICDECDIVVYIFNGDDYLKPSLYKTDVNDILKVIYQRFEAKNKGFNNAVIIASKADLYEKRTGNSRKKMLNEIIKRVPKDRCNLLTENFYAINCACKEEVINVAESLFEKGLFNK